MAETAHVCVTVRARRGLRRVGLAAAPACWLSAERVPVCCVCDVESVSTTTHGSASSWWVLCSMWSRWSWPRCASVRPSGLFMFRGWV